jgi:TRAP-type transport system periplasmic protein
MRFARLALLVLASGTAPLLARADEVVTLRMGSIVPEGTAWAREMHALTRDVAARTSGQVDLRWYLSGIAGDDLEAARRVERDQLDGIGAGSWQCERWAPSVTVTRLPGLYRDREESRFVAMRLRDVFEAEYAKAGFVLLGDSQIGPSMIFTRAPVRTMDELRRTKLWTLDNDLTKRRILTALGLTLVPLPFDRSRQAYDAHEVDGFLAPPTGALAFQWSTQARYLLDVPTDYILGCVVIKTRAFDRLTFAQQQAVRAAAATFAVRFDEVGAHTDEQLLGGLFEKQGLTLVHPDARFAADFERAAQAAWAEVGDKMVPKELVDRVRAMLTARRASQH